MIALRRCSLRDRRGSSLDRPSRPPMLVFHQRELQRSAIMPNVPRMSSLYTEPSDRDPLAGDGATTRPFSMRRDPPNIGNHIPEFVRQCLRSALGSSLGASELRGSYETWCAVHKYEPVTPTETGRGTEGPRVREVEILRSDPLQGPTTYSLNAPVTFVASRLWLGYS